MSGGTFNYNQSHISSIAEEIEKEMAKNGKPKSQRDLKEESWRDQSWYKKYPEDLNHHKYPEEVIEEFKMPIKHYVQLQYMPKGLIGY